MKAPMARAAERIDQHLAIGAKKSAFQIGPLCGSSGGRATAGHNDDRLAERGGDSR